VRLLMDFLVNSVGDVFAWLFLCGAGLFAVLTVATIVLAAVAAGGMPVVPYLLAAAGLTIQAGLMALLGLAGDYVQRTYRQSSGQPLYLIRCVHERESAQRGDGRGR
ncbi:MAG: hypothetical protein NTY02_18885, partial [Acidobacteria bacterium]|nr:hypothetical protein [Acidobacteriota bacterium]